MPPAYTPVKFLHGALGLLPVHGQAQGSVLGRGGLLERPHLPRSLRMETREQVTLRTPSRASGVQISPTSKPGPLSCPGGKEDVQSGRTFAPMVLLPPLIL